VKRAVELIRYFIIASALVSTAGCGSALKIDGPQESYTPVAFYSTPSVLPIVAEIDLKGLERTVNKRFDGLLYEDKGAVNKELEIKVWKAGNFSLMANNDEISYRIPLRIWSRFTWRVEKFGLYLTDWYEATGSLALVYRTKLGADGNWNLTTRTTPSGYSWIETPRINIAGVTIPVKPIADYALSRTERAIATQIDMAVAESFNMREYVEGFWQEIQEPTIADSTYNVWVRVIPRGATLSPITSSSGKLRIPVTFTGDIETVAGDSIHKTTLVPLPPLGNSNNKPEKFNINLNADVTFDQITKAAMQQLSGMEFSEGGKRVVVKGLELYSSSGRPVVAIDVEGSIKGRLFLTGELGYDRESQTLSVQNADFDIKTRNALVKSASWLLHGFLLRKIQPFLSYNIATMLEESRAEADNMLKKYSLAEGVYLDGTLEAISVSNIVMIPGAVRISATLTGDVKIITTEF
jgi:hypothetical protein